MAKAKVTAASSFRKRVRRKRKGVHSKCKQSSHKHGKNYQKKYAGHGK